MKSNNEYGIILNDDFAHFFSSRHRYGIHVTREVIEEYIDQYIGTQLTEFCLNINAALSYSPSKVMETVFDKYLQKEVKGIPVDFRGTYLESAYDIYVNRGLDVHKIMIERLHHIGIEPWISIRMNDLHGFKDSTDNRTTDFRNYAVENGLCRTTHRPHHDYYDQCFDYMKPEIYERMIAYIDEQLTNYDVDGIELDFLREAYCFKIGDEDKGREVINKMIRHIKNTASDLSKERGHSIKILVRIPSNPVHAYDMGFDFYTWAKESLVDILVVTPRFTTCDSTIPMKSWVRMFEDYDMKVVGGIEFFTNPRINEIDFSFGNTPEIAAGYAVQYLSAGTEKIYLYNYFDDPGMEGNPEVDTMSFTDSEIECDSDRGACAQAQCYIMDLLSNIGSLKTCINLPRRHILTYNDIAPPWVRKDSALPITVNKPNYKKVTIKTEYICIKTGRVPPDKQAYILLGIKNADSGKDLNVWCNNVLCEFFRTTKIYPHMSPSTVYVYKIPSSALKNYSQIFEFASETNGLVINYAEVRIIRGI